MMWLTISLVTVGVWIGWEWLDRHKSLKTVPSNDLTDYTKYEMNIKEKCFTAIISCSACFVIGLIFYKQLLIAFVISLFGLLFIKVRKKTKAEQRKQRIAYEFKQSLFSLSTSLAAGKSLENSFRDVIQDLPFLFPGKQSIVMKEFEVILNKVENGEPIEQAIADFARRSGIEDIENFSDILTICKRTGGDLMEVIRRSSNIIGDKMRIQQEISVMIAQKKFESNLLSLIPFGLVALVSYSSPDYMAPLYSGVGVVIMTLCLIWLIFAIWLISKIMKIKV